MVHLQNKTFHRQLLGLSPCLKFVIGGTLTILSWDNPVTAFLNFEFWEETNVKKILILLLCLFLMVSITGCGTQSIKPINTIEGNIKTYSEMSDGTWQCDGHIYKYRLEISGRLSNAAKDSTYIYLSNTEDITFEQAWKASGLSSNMDDYFDIDEAVLVELPD